MDKKSILSIEITEIESRKGGGHGHEVRISGNMTMHEAQVLFSELLTKEMDNNLSRGFRAFLVEHFGILPIALTKEEVIKTFGKEALEKLEAEEIKKKARRGD
jgi:hypothetical protein